MYIREDIPSKLLSTDLSIEGFFVEMRLRKKTWLLCSSYNLKKNLIANHLNCIDRKLDSQLGQYEVIEVIEIGLSDFNKMSLTVMKVFYDKQKPKIIQYRKYKVFTMKLLCMN